MGFIIGIFNLYRSRYGFFRDLFVQHILLSGVAIILITIIGLILGIYITRNKKVAGIVQGIINFLYTIPSIALFGFLVALCQV